MEISRQTLINNPNRKDVLDLAIGLLTDMFGPVHTYEELVSLLQREFPELAFTYSEVVEFFQLSMMQEELHQYLEHINYVNGSMYQYIEAY